MQSFKRLSVLVIGSVVATQTPATVSAERATPGGTVTVLELFTSQGCSACPKANAELLALSRQPDVIALSYSVDYWDYLGWKDTMARPEFVAHQRAYVDRFDLSGPYTPQVVINGRTEAAASRRADLTRAVNKARAAAQPTRLTLSEFAGGTPGQFGTTLPELSNGSAVWLVGFEPGEVALTPRSGVNRGKAMVVANPAKAITPLAPEQGAIRFSCPTTACAVLVQDSRGHMVASGVTPYPAGSR